MDITQIKIKAQYPRHKLVVGSLMATSFSYRGENLKNMVHVGIWDGEDILEKRTLQFTRSQFEEMILEQGENGYLYPQLADEWDNVDRNIMDAQFDIDELSSCVSLCGRIEFPYLSQETPMPIEEPEIIEDIEFHLPEGWTEISQVA